MKNCPARTQLEAVALSQLPELHAREVEAHASSCQRCRHELNWLRTETGLFAQRAAREEVGRLWRAVDVSRKSKRGHRLTRVFLGAAAAVMVVVAGSQLSAGGHSSARHFNEPLPMSLELMSVGSSESLPASMPCYTPGMGIACGEVQFASR